VYVQIVTMNQLLIIIALDRLVGIIEITNVIIQAEVKVTEKNTHIMLIHIVELVDCASVLLEKFVANLLQVLESFESKFLPNA